MTGVELALPVTVGVGAVSAAVAAAAQVDPGPSVSIGLASAGATGLAFVVWLLRRLDERAIAAKAETIALLSQQVADLRAELVHERNETRRVETELARERKRLVDLIAKIPKEDQ